MTEPVEIAQITITKTFDDDVEGGMACEVEFSEGLSLIDALGMLTFATLTTLPTYMEDES